MALLLTAGFQAIAIDPAHAGADPCTDEEERIAAEAAQRWAGQGEAAMPEMMDGLSSGNLCLQWAADEALVALGLPAARALLPTLEIPAGDAHASTLGHLMCAQGAQGEHWDRIAESVVGLLDESRAGGSTAAS